MAADFTIGKNVNGRWVVAPADPGKRFRPRGVVTWELRGGPGVSAHFQFADADLVEDAGDANLTGDWTAVIREGETLRLRIKSEAFLSLSPRYYAVWICDPNSKPPLRYGGMYAIGENPPPKIDLTE